MSRIFTVVSCFLFFINSGFGQSASFQTYMNPVIPGDHPDCTLTKVGNDFYTTGSSFNPTPVIYHSTDLVHWEAIAQPVSAAWSNYGDAPAGGCWGGQVVYYNNKWWDFFCRNWQMYFVTADSVRGPWSMPTLVNNPSSVSGGLGYDNSIFVDDDSTWYLLVKNGQAGNWIVQLGNNGQPSGKVLNLTWINPAPSYPYSWAEGPVMWKHGGYYYYAFAQNVAGGEYVMRSKTLTDSSSSWTTPVNFFNTSDPQASSAVFGNPNHCSAAVVIDDSTVWILHPVWRTGSSNEWYSQGRQGLLNQVRYDSTGEPTADYPVNAPKDAPKLPSSGIPWMVPHSDFFDSNKLNPEWSFLGYTASNAYSLTARPGWLTLSPRGGEFNTVIKNDGEHNYSVTTRLEFKPQSVSDEAGIWIVNGPEAISAKLFSSIDSSGNKIVTFSYEITRYTIPDPAGVGDSTLWLKLVRVNHMLTGYCSTDGYDWIRVGSSINVTDLDGYQSNYNSSWTGNRQGLFVQGGVPAGFDFYIYRDAYTPILAECPANQYGTTVSARVNGMSSLTNIHDGDWALYAGLEFGNSEYVIEPDSIHITASCASSGGVVEVWLDSIDTGTKIAECNITNTGSWSNYETFSTNVLTTVSGNRDVYLKFKGAGSGNLFMLQWVSFVDKSHPLTSIHESRSGLLPKHFELEQNYPNPFNPATRISYQLPVASNVTLKIYDVLGREVATLVDERQSAGYHGVTFDAGNLASGVYFYRIGTEMSSAVKKLTLVK
ncbi:MAG TPA: family 43 glycosylhydrolase [Candidatus Acidoferrales bacterium]|nr:family 43 glycosylhydrolase [Candidatus Acidoferrales bacterium]